MGQKGLTFINGQKKFGVGPNFYINIYILVSVLAIIVMGMG